jgi:hypothetical protein
MRAKNDGSFLMLRILRRPPKARPPARRAIRPVLWSLAAAAAVGHGPASAQTSLSIDPRWSLVPSVGWVLADGDRRAAHGAMYGLSLSRVIATDWDLALRGAWEKLGAEPGGPGRYSNWSISADGHWYFAGRQGMNSLGGGQPFALAGLGLINERVPGTTETSWMAQAGVGADWGMGAWGRLQLDARYRLDANSAHLGQGGRFGDWIIGLGWRVPLGAPVQPSVPSRSLSDPPAPPVSPAMIRPATPR